MSTMFNPTANDVKNVVSQYVMQRILKNALLQFGADKIVPKLEQTTTVFNKAISFTTKRSA